MSRLDRAERAGALQAALLRIFPGWQSQIRTAGPAIIKSFNAEECTAVVELAIQGKQRLPNNKTEDLIIKEIQDVPVIFPGGGDYLLTFPVAAGDECLVIVSDRCIDAWWEQGEISPQFEMRMHDFSDGFAIIGPFSKPKVPSNIKTDVVQLRSKDETCYIEMGNGKIKFVAPLGFEFESDGYFKATVDGLVRLEAGAAIEVDAGAAVSVSALGSIDLDSDVEVAITAPSITEGS